MPDTAETAHIKAPRSMAHLLRTTLMAVGILSLLLSVVGAALLFQHAFAEQFDTDLSRTVEAIAVGYEHSADPQPEQLAQYADGLRLTLVAQDGTVLYDSATADPSILPNHANRPEIQQAMAEGTGASVRRSATLGYDTHYYAVRLTDGSVLRLADETSNMWSSYNRVLPVLVAGCILIIILALVLAQVITKHLVQPITQMAEHLDCIEANVPYEELIPLAHTVQSDRKLREDNETIRREFTANVSHELKTPLTSISGYAELIENGMAKQEDIPTFGHRIHKEAQRMITLVSDILQLSELDGLIITEIPPETLEFITTLNKKIVFVDNYIDGYCNIGYNTVYANQLIFDHIIKCGYKKIAYIGGASNSSAPSDFDSCCRMMIFRETLRANNIPYDPELIYNCDWDSKVCAAQVKELLSKHPETEVIFAGSDSLASVILSQLKKLNLKCPQDIGVVGFNDISHSKNFSPALTTVRLPSAEMGKLAAEVLIRQIKSNSVLKQQILLPVELKVRESTRKIR